MKLAVMAIAMASLVALPVAAQGVTATAHIVITGGPKPGTYDISVTRAGCSAGATGPGSFGTQISDSKAAPDALGSVQFIVPTPSAAGSPAMQMIVRIGSIMNPTAEFNIYTLPAAAKVKGKGTVKVAGYASSTPNMTFDVTTDDHVHLVGSVSCKAVTRM